MTTATHDVYVRKDIKLATGESLADYTSAIRDAGQKFLTQKLNLKSDSGPNGTTCDCYSLEIFSKSIIFCVYKYGPKVAADDRSRYYALGYTRNSDGTFEFTSPVEVERVTSFQVKPAASSVTKAVMSTASANNLPDAAFAVILPGGKKDASGKTTPRSLRLLPHHTAAVKSGSEDSSVDLPHLRNALARLSQAKISPAEMAKAKAHLEAHAKALLPSDKPVKKQFEEGWALTDKAFWGGVL